MSNLPTPFLDLLRHEVMPDFNSRAFWCSKSPSLFLQSLIVGLLLSLYMLLVTKIIVTIIFFATGAEQSPIFHILHFIDNDIDRPWFNVQVGIFYAIFIFVGENITRAVLDIAAKKPFAPSNSARFMRASIGVTVVTLFQMSVRISERLQDIPSSSSGTLVFFLVFTAVIFASLSLAFKQGAQLQADQDLTV